MLNFRTVKSNCNSPPVVAKKHKMNKADLYRKVNQAQRIYARAAFNEFASVFKWRWDGCDSVLDAGCGSGDVTLDIVLPILPANFSRLVGVDISNAMIDYARKTHVHPKVSFEPMDLDMELEKQQFYGVEPFDHIVSFSTLMWIQNQKLCIRNFHKLLKPDGDMLLVFLAQHPLYDGYKRQSEDIRWSEYMKDVDRVITPYQYSMNPKEEFEILLSDCGFTGCDVRVKYSTHIHDFAELRNILHSISPFIDRVPVEGKQQFLDDLIQQYVKLGYALDDSEKENENCRLKFSYKQLVTYARE